VVSDLHYAGAEERARGHPHVGLARSALSRLLLRVWDRHLWMRDPGAHNDQLHRFVAGAPPADWVIANGDYSCDSRFTGVSDDASLASALECLEQLRGRFEPRFRALIGDHELGKWSLVGARGGLRLASWERTRERLGLEPFWRLDLGRYTLVGVTSTLLALPVFEREALPEEWPQWQRLRAEHRRQVCDCFAGLDTARRVLLFCHDPTALPFLWEEDSVRAKSEQIERTIIGHLHSRLILWKSRVLAGMPPIRFLGNSLRRMSVALHRARHWRPFKPLLCPSLAGVELFKSGGYLKLSLDPDGRQPVRVRGQRIAWRG
jgi:hypothetical protein